jgi:integrase
MYALKALCKRADVPRRSPYACRHTYASVLLTAGYPAVEVAEYLGDRVSIVLDSYAHFIPETRVSRDQNRDQSSDSPARISNLDAGIPFQEGKTLISTS